MANLTPEGLRMVSEAGARHGFSVEAALGLVDSLLSGQGMQAQFNHPEFGGMGQWSRGGMIMIGDMFNQGLKYRVDALCNELSGLIGQQASVFAPAQSSQSQSQGVGYSQFLNGPSSWWPAEFGPPSSSGAQNDMRYAFFPAARRLAIQQGDRMEIYDTGDHSFSGFSQQQGGGQSLSFSSQYGTIRVADLPLVSGDREDRGASASPPAPAPLGAASAIAEPTPPSTPLPRSSFGAAPSALNSTPSSLASDAANVVTVLRELAALRQEGILTDEEFAAKKAELLSRL